MAFDNIVSTVLVLTD